MKTNISTLKEIRNLKVQVNMNILDSKIKCHRCIDIKVKKSYP